MPSGDLRPALGACSLPSYTPPFPAPGIWAQRTEKKSHLGTAEWGDPHSKKSSVPSLLLFPYLGGERQLGPALCPGTSSPASCLPLGTILPGAQGPGPDHRDALLPKNLEWAGPGASAGASLPVSHSPGPGQHVDVSAELSRILGHLLCCGIVPRILWLQRGPQGTQGWRQQQSHARGQEEQEEAAVHGGHLRSQDQGGRGSTEPTLPPSPSPSPISPSLETKGQSKGLLGADHPTS